MFDGVGSIVISLMSSVFGASEDRYFSARTHPVVAATSGKEYERKSITFRLFKGRSAISAEGGIESMTDVTRLYPEL